MPSPKNPNSEPQGRVEDSDRARTMADAESPFRERAALLIESARQGHIGAEIAGGLAEGYLDEAELAANSASRSLDRAEDKKRERTAMDKAIARRLGKISIPKT